MSAHSVTIEDYGKVVDPSEAKFSPDGKQIAYHHRGEVYVVPSEGGAEPVKLSKAESGYSNVQPVWSLDGKRLYLSYYSAERKSSEIYAAQVDDSAPYTFVTRVSSDVYGLNLSPDHTRWLFAASETPQSSSDAISRSDSAPIVVDAMVFKQDGKGYLEVDASDNIYAWDIATNMSTQLSDETGYDSEPAWSADGSNVAFIREELSKAEYRSDLCIVSSQGMEKNTPASLTPLPADRRSPIWSPDGKLVAYLWRDPTLGPYAVTRLATYSLDTGQETVITQEHDRTITYFRFSPDGLAICFLFDNEGGSHLSRIRLSDNQIESLVSGDRYIESFDINKDDQLTLNMKNINDAIDVYTIRDGSPFRLTQVNSRYFEKKSLASKEHLFYTLKSGLRIQALITKPVGFDPTKKYPAVLRIHGGPVQQAKFGYDFFSQYLAAHGYVVVEPNPPGSTGRGQDFISRVKRNWGFKKKPDVLGAIDAVVKLGYADPKQLAVVGYSYGGYMTNCVITVAPTKFKAAISGAGHSFIAANYGHDIYLKWYNWGLGHLWHPESREKYEKLSPLNYAGKVRTPTLFMCGAKDWNVPILNAELFYQALRVRGVPTQLVVYPKAAHTTHWDDDECENGKDYYQRVLSWLDKFLK